MFMLNKAALLLALEHVYGKQQWSICFSLKQVETTLLIQWCEVMK